jgi:hypothetical protein
MNNLSKLIYKVYEIFERLFESNRRAYKNL